MIISRGVALRLAAAALSAAPLLRSASADPSDYYYCGTTWSDANSRCQDSCPNGVDSECPPGEGCFAECTACPPSGGGAPTSPPAPTPPANPVGPAGDDSRMVAFLGNWQPCPTAAQTDQYTHIVISFAVSYTFQAGSNICDQQCTINSPIPICDNQDNRALVDAWRSQGKKVLLSFGGAGMGGSWGGDPNYCWEYCFSKEASVVSQLDAIVRNQNFDGVDIDYEYFYEDNDNYRGGTGATGDQARNFIEQVTVGLKAQLPAGQNLVTHAPMDSDMVVGSSYYDILVNNAASLDFLMPQYYNGIVRPITDGIDGGSPSAISHFNNLVSNMFSGDATKVVFGFCISACSGYNANAQQALTVMNDLSGYHVCNGGAFFWVVNSDVSGAWSSTVNAAIQPSAGCSSEPTALTPTAPQPVPTPVEQPAPTPTVSQPTPTLPTGPMPTPPSSCPNTDNSAQVGGCGPESPCSGGECCSQWGWCGSIADYCEPSLCCQSNCWGSEPTPTSAAPVPIVAPTKAPTRYPTTDAPSKTPTTDAPSKTPTTEPPTRTPTDVPSKKPTTDAPTRSPTGVPSRTPTTDAPSVAPTAVPSKTPTTNSPTRAPTNAPTASPVTSVPTKGLAGVGEPCTEPSHCQSDLCSGGRRIDRVCLGNAPEPAPVPTPVEPPTSAQQCYPSGTPCGKSDQCCLGVCRGSGRCK